MEWLIGKARGARGIISSSSSSSATSHTTTSSSCPGGPPHDTAASTLPPAYIEPHFASQRLLLNSVEFSALVEPFPYVNQDEWLAVHANGLFENVNNIYDAVYELCSCPTMTGPGTLIYVATDEKGKKVKCSARQYMDSILTQSLILIKSTKYFPTRWGEPFPPDFRTHIVSICRNLFQVLVHLYAAHFSGIDSLELVPYLNTVAKHFFYFNSRFNLIDDKEVEVLADLQAALIQHDSQAVTTSSTSECSSGDDKCSPSVDTKGDSADTVSSSYCSKKGCSDSQESILTATSSLSSMAVSSMSPLCPGTATAGHETSRSRCYSKDASPIHQSACPT